MSRLVGKVVEVARRVGASAWGPVVAKTAGFGVLLMGLALLGSGVFDQWMTPRPAAAANLPRKASYPRASGGEGPKGRAAGAPEELAHAAKSAAPVEEAAPASPAASAIASASATAASTTAAPASRTPDGKLILNLANEKDFDALPGIGMSKAKAIVELRTKLGGRFKRLEDLMRIRGIKKKLIEKLRPLIVLDAPA